MSQFLHLKLTGPIHFGLTAHLLLPLLCFFNSCNGFLDIEPPTTQLVSRSVFKDDLTARSAMAGLYYRLGAGGFAAGSANSVTFLGTLLADDSRYTSNSVDYQQFSTNTLLPANSRVATLWGDLYSMVYDSNLLLEQLAGAEALSAEVRSRLQGEALFIRAFCYFYLVNLFGDVPLTITTDYRQNNVLVRTPATLVYERILQDLGEAAVLLPEEYEGGERARPAKGAALAMTARVHLYLKQWKQAEAVAAMVITDENYALEPVAEVFLKNSREAIWQLVPSNRQESNYTQEAGLFMIADRLSGHALRDEWVENGWENGDLRKESWIGIAEGDFGRAYYPFKYKENASNATGAEYSMVFRLAEILLIRAEARARLSDLEGAKQDLDQIRTRAGLPPVAATSQEELLDAVMDERRKELFTEWGQRWFDLVRTDLAGVELQPIKPDWTSSDVLLPIPETELLTNRKLGQNPGY